VIGELIGIPRDRLGAFLEWTEALITADPHKEWETNPFPMIYGEFAKLLEERRGEPRDDLMSALLEAEVEGFATCKQTVDYDIGMKNFIQNGPRVPAVFMHE